MLRNGFYLPKIKSSMVTEEYMRNVLTGKAFCPKYDQIKLHPCPRPPGKDVLLRKYQELCDANDWGNTGVDEKHQPDKRWLLDFISTFNPRDEIFAKSYLPPVKETKLSELKTIELPTSFVQNLPQTTRKSRRKGLRLSKEGIAGQKMERLKRLRKELSDRILDEEVKQEETKSKGRVRGIRSVTNESTFKLPGPIPTTPTKTTTSGGSTSGMSSGSKPQSLNNSAM